MNPEDMRQCARVTHEHCYHAYLGPLWIVVPDGHCVQKCCGCEEWRIIHRDHMGDVSWKRKGPGATPTPWA